MAGETYVKRYAGSFVDKPTLTTPIDAQFLNAVETALLRLLGEDPAADEVGVWVPGSNRFVFQKITNDQIDPAAAINKSKLGPLAIVDADVSASAAIAKSKLAALNIANADVASGAAVAVNKLAAGSNGQFLKTSGGAPVWGAQPTQIELGIARGTNSVVCGAAPATYTTTIAHGLGVTPTVALVSPLNDWNTGSGYIGMHTDSYDATNFRAVVVWPFGSGATMSFAWVAVA